MEPLVGVVKTGKRLSTGFVSPYLGKSSTPQHIKVAEETGQLDITLLGLADRYEDEGRRTMGRVGIGRCRRSGRRRTRAVTFVPGRCHRWGFFIAQHLLDCLAKLAL